MAVGPPRWEALFVERMVQERSQRGMSQNELARRATDRGLSVQQPTVHRIEAGVRPVRLNEAVVLAEVLGFDLSEVLGADEHVQLVRSLETWLSTADREFAAAIASSVTLLRETAAARERWDRLLDSTLASGGRHVGSLLTDVSVKLDQFTPELAAREARRSTGVDLSDEERLRLLIVLLGELLDDQGTAQGMAADLAVLARDVTEPRSASSRLQDVETLRPIFLTLVQALAVADLEEQERGAAGGEHRDAG